MSRNNRGKARRAATIRVRSSEGTMPGDHDPLWLALRLDRDWFRAHQVAVTGYDAHFPANCPASQKALRTSPSVNFDLDFAYE
jgi:hypothetical protein